ncbi:SCPL20 [Symbiodinium sp. KB8]|nr:SCPL20 [Symbiodinium sp. KB8]
MGFEVSEPWRAWEVDEQVAGYVTSYKTEGEGSFQFITVKGAGHMVPEYKPVQASAMLERFLAKKPF